MKEPQKIHNKWLCSIQLYLQKGTEGGFVPWVVVCWPVLQTSVDKPQLHIQLHICNWSQSAEACSTGPCRKPGFDPWVGKFPWRREWLPTLVFLPGKSPEERSLVGKLSVGSQRVIYHWATNTFTFHISVIHCSSLQMALSASKFISPSEWIPRFLWKEVWHPDPSLELETGLW